MVKLTRIYHGNQSTAVQINSVPLSLSHEDFITDVFRKCTVYGRTYVEHCILCIIIMWTGEGMFAIKQKQIRKTQGVIVCSLILAL